MTEWKTKAFSTEVWLLNDLRSINDSNYQLFVYDSSFQRDNDVDDMYEGVRQEFPFFVKTEKHVHTEVLTAPF